MSEILLDEHIVAQFSHQQMQTYFSLYLKNARELIKQMRTAIENQNFEGLQQRAHKLKGSSMVVGASQIKKLAHDLEVAARERQTVEPARADELQTNYELLVDLLAKRYNLSFNS